MHQLRRLPAEIRVEQQVFGRARNPFFAAKDVRDLHEMIVDDVGEMIGRQAVGLHQHLHVDGRPVELDRTAAQIFDDADAFVGNVHPHDVRFAGRFAPRDFLGRIASGRGRRSATAARPRAARRASPRGAPACRSI